MLRRFRARNVHAAPDRTRAKLKVCARRGRGKSVLTLSFRATFSVRCFRYLQIVKRSNGRANHGDGSSWQHQDLHASDQWQGRAIRPDRAPQVGGYAPPFGTSDQILDVKPRRCRPIRTPTINGASLDTPSCRYFQSSLLPS